MVMCVGLVGCDHHEHLLVVLSSKIHQAITVLIGTLIMSILHMRPIIQFPMFCL